MEKLSKTQAAQRVSQFFQRPDWPSEELRKIKRLGMKYHLKLSPHKHLFCKKCLLPLKGTVRVTKTHKTIVCIQCGTRNMRRLVKRSP